MARPALLLFALACASSLVACGAPAGSAHAVASKSAASASSASSAKQSFERMSALQGDWVGEGPPDVPGEMTVNYRLTGGGSALVETLFAGEPHEMVTVYTVENGDLMLTHYCALGNQPRMRAEAMRGNALDFHFVGGGNIDPAHDQHMHDAHFEFVSNDELVTAWTGWVDGRPAADHGPRLHLKRKS